MDVSEITISADATIFDGVEAIDRGARQIALVVDSDGRLVATVTDGDIRRGLLRGLQLENPISDVMNTSPVTLQVGAALPEDRAMMHAKGLHQLPVVDANGAPVALFWIDDLAGSSEHGAHVILMAGGLGTRLRPLTEAVPKPMLQVGGRPILELILRQLVAQGLRRVTISINYLGHIVRDHFGDGSAFGAEIDYVEETERMGTAGAMSLLNVRPKTSVLVMNGDLLTALDYNALISFHEDASSVATMCAREYSVEVPYGVINFDGERLLGIEEKPVHRHYVNAGIYVFSPEALDELQPSEPLDMPQLFERLIEKDKKTTVFPLREYWMDIGRHEDLERAREEVHTKIQL